MSARENSDRLRTTLGYASSSPPKLPTSPPFSSPDTLRDTPPKAPEAPSPSTSPDIPLSRLRARHSRPTLRSPQPLLSGPPADNAPSSPAKRKAAAPLNPESPSKRPKQDSETPEAPPQPKKLIPFPEKPAVIEEREGDIEFRVVNNDGKRESTIILTGLKCIFQKQLPKMPKDYIARLVYDRTHLSIAIVKKPLEVVGGITYRPFHGRQFAEIVFCAISSDQQVKGYGAHLMSHLKDYVKATSDVMHFLTYADNYAIGYFKKQGFTKEITLEKSRWMGYIKDYEGGTIMQCSMVPKIRYLESGRMLLKQKECVNVKIRSVSKSFEVHAPPPQWKNSLTKIDPLTIAAIKRSGWSPAMDELARAPRHGPNYNQLLHLLNDLQNNSNAWPFQQPVNKDEVLDYYDVIKEPMDLATMEEKHEKDLYPTPEDFVRDAKLIFDNCRKYNNESTPYAKAANRLEKYMWSRIREIPEWAHLEADYGGK
ncbi:histone acetyltransferase, variant 2 [Paraphaeosphaeria sporulosa]